MTARTLKRFCLSLPGAVEEFPFGPQNAVYKVGGKIFAIGGDEPLRMSLKCEPELAEQLRAAYRAIVPGYHLNKRHWNTVTIDGSVPDQTLRDMIEDSYDLVVSKQSKARQRELGWEGAR